MPNDTVKAIREEYPQRRRYIPLREAAADACCHPQTLRKAFRMRELRGFRRGRTLYFQSEDLDKWMSRFEQRPGRES